jgi:hypothetical protein
MTSACCLHNFVIYIIIYEYIRKVEIRVPIADWYAPWKISSDAENLIFQSLQFQKMDVCLKFPDGSSISHY